MLVRNCLIQILCNMKNENTIQFCIVEKKCNCKKQGEIQSRLVYQSWNLTLASKSKYGCHSLFSWIS
jgi:hypothetical protein